jgi:hypothetical protein
MHPLLLEESTSVTASATPRPLATFLASSHTMSDEPLFLDSPEYEQSSTEEKIRDCDIWLQKHPNCRLVIHIKRLLVELQAEREPRQQSEQREREKSLASLLTHYPVLKDLTASGPYVPINHASAKIDESEDDLPSIDGLVDGNFWGTELWATRQEESINCDSEIHAQSHVVTILKSVLAGLKLTDVVEIVLNRTLAGSECDILLVYKPNRLPFSAIEVKKPANTPKAKRMIFDGKGDKNLIAGELYDECKAVELFGFEKVVGMVTTGNHWRLSCTKKETKLSFFLGLNKVVQRLREHVAGHKVPVGPEEDTISPSQSEVVFDGENPGSTTVERVLYSSAVVPNISDNLDDDDAAVSNAGKDIVNLVVLYVLKACLTLVVMLDHNLSKNMIVVRPKMPCRLLTRNERVFAFGTVTLKKLNLGSFIQKNLQKLHVIHHIASGEYGSCCLCVTVSGASCCAVKFFHRSKGGDFATRAQAELENWKTVYGEREGFACETWKVAGSECLVMPYLKPVNPEQRHALLTYKVCRVRAHPQ